MAGLTGPDSANPIEPDGLVDWSFAFGAEALPQQVNSRDAAARPIDLRLRQPGLLWLWEVDGQPVSTAYLTRSVAGVSPVSGYTHRRSCAAGGTRAGAWPA